MVYFESLLIAERRIKMAENTSNVSDRKINKEDFSWRAGWVDGVIALITVLGNMLVILLILTRASLRTKQNWFVLSLAVADFLVAAIVFPLRLAIGYLYFGKTKLFIDATHDFLLYASTLNLSALTLDRYLYIVHPMKYLCWKRKTNLIKTSLVAWIVAFFIPHIRLLINLYVENTEVEKNFILFLLCFETVPCLCLPTAYLHILYFVRRQKAQMKMQMRQVQHNYVVTENPEKYQTSKRSKILVLGEVIGFFVLSNVVHITRAWLKYLLSTPIFNKTFSRTSYFLIHANSAINVFVYGLFKEDFRREMKRVFCKRTSPPSISQPAAAAHIELQ
ncbi:dopamine receptor 1-like [Actinia tenebrosa]|uniref:Dopamine receptor 1-like n=1 Tax=Actinia tenebrosa TaxID=6105 RepID=A0A6P8IDT6_ACTTE|nr:dopamine receptor 1-like [Actinia tenebrosa]